jgi:hypothetical protein
VTFVRGRDRYDCKANLGSFSGGGGWGKAKSVDRYAHNLNFEGDTVIAGKLPWNRAYQFRSAI